MHHLDANGIKPDIYSKITDKHTTELPSTVCLGVDWPVCDIYIALTKNIARSIKSLTEMHFFLFLQVTFYTSKNFLDRRTLNNCFEVMFIFLYLNEQI